MQINPSVRNDKPFLTAPLSREPMKALLEREGGIRKGDGWVYPAFSHRSTKYKNTLRSGRCPQRPIAAYILTLTQLCT